MSDMLAIGSSALLAYRDALSVISNNISNANTPGYARERINLQAATGSSLSSNLLQGVQVQGVQRLTDGMLQQQLNADTSSLNSVQAVQSYASQIDGWLSGSGTGLSTPLQTLGNDLNTLSSNPTSSAARATVLSDLNNLSGTFNSLSSQIQSLDGQLGQAVQGTTTEINGYATQLAALNKQIAQAAGQVPGQAPNSLLDQRDALLQQLSADVSFTTTQHPDGTVDVFIGSGQALVQAGTANSLVVKPDTYGDGQDVVLQASGGSSTVITSQLSGGTLGGLLSARQTVIQPAQNQLGRLAVAVASAFNSQNAMGVTASGSLGGALFQVPAPGVTPASTNSGSASVNAVVASVGSLTSDDYVLAYQGGSWSLTDTTTGTSVALSGSGTSASPLTGAGLSITVAGTPANGDRFLVAPTRNAAGQLAVAITDPGQIAVASAIQVNASAGNLGNATVSSASATNPSNASLLSTATIQFTSATTYSINGAGSFTYTPGSSISANGWQVTLSGTPASGDAFVVSANSGRGGDNSNATALAALAKRGILDGGATSLLAANTALVTSTGTIAQQSTAQVTAQQTLVSQAQSANGAVSGVNLDQEAASMMQFQQAYEAAAQVIATSNTLFQSLISALHS